MKKQRQHCLYCGRATIKKYEDNVRRDFCPACNSFFYENPLPVVSSILDSSRRILLVKRSRPPFKGMWCLPTGFAEAGESIEDATLRELEEETGIKGRIVKLLDVDSYKSRFYGDLLFLTFVVEEAGGKLAAGGDSEQARFWPVSKLPPMAFPPNKRALDAYIKSKRDYWAIFDSIERTDEKKPSPTITKNPLTKRLVNFILKNKEDIINQWVDDVAVNPSTTGYVGLQMYNYGLPDRVGLNDISYVGSAPSTLSGKVVEFSYENPGGEGGDETYIQSGDSGGPSFVISGGKLALVGLHYYNWAPNPPYSGNVPPNQVAPGDFGSGDTFVPNYVRR